MNKFDKLRLALILQDIEAYYSGNPVQNITSTAGTLMANVDENGFDKQDIAKLMVDQVADQSPNGAMFKIQNNIALHKDELVKAFNEAGDKAGLQALENGDLQTLYKSISSLVYKNKKLKDGGIIDDDSENVTIVRIGKKSYRAIVAETEEEKERGLQDVEELECDKNGGEAMLFVYDSPQHLDFWMKDCDLTLSIIFLDANKVVLSNQKGVPNTEDYISEDNAQYVLEVNYTEDIKPGDKAVFNLGEELEMEPGKLYILGEDGTPQGQTESGSRIFSRANSQTLIRMAKRANESKLDKDYKALGRKVFEYLEIQDNREPEYVTE